MAIQRVCICHVQVPFVRGGSELLVESLQKALRQRGIATDVVSLPFKWYPSREVLTHALAWRLLDLTESQGRPIDLVIGTKFPSYLIRHPNKVTWLFHQFRQAYDLYGSPFGELTDSPEDQEVLNTVRNMDATLLPESKRLYTIAGNVSQRLQRFNGLDSEVLYPPPPLENRYYCEDYDNYVLSLGRLESIKRVDLLLKSVQQAKDKVRCVVAGTGPEEANLKALAKELGIEQQVTFAGYVSEGELLELYARCRAVYYAPYDEDYGFVTLEALRAQKPVIATNDSGGVLEFVRHEETGLIAEPEPAALAALLDRVTADPDLCRRLGEQGKGEVQDISWDKVLDALLQTAP